MTYLNALRCTQCGKEFEPGQLRYLCDVCSRDYHPGMPLKGILEAVFDYEGIRRAWDEYLSAFPEACEQQKMEELCELFSPVAKEHYPNLPVGYTPLIECANLVAEPLYLKFDGVNPSGSFKDRASHLVVAEAKRLGIREIVAASTGNAASSLAAICASAGIRAVIFTPAKAPIAKLVQIRIHGAELHKVDGTYDDAFAQALEYSATRECLNRNTAYHPYTIEGKKTAGLELFIQLKKSSGLHLCAHRRRGDPGRYAQGFQRSEGSGTDRKAAHSGGSASREFRRHQLLSGNRILPGC